VRKPHPPIYIGATSTWAIERIVDYADGWLPVAVPEFEERLTLLQQLCEERGRDFAEIDISLFTNVASKDNLVELASKGVNRIILSLPTLDEGESLKVLDQYQQIVEWASELD
jgi:alkanesulfonate monooxygenase SsuD/methylene tetrahydromethanopterin reductase-like flavin-dependent oxidoreductase (luciferase family)